MILYAIHRIPFLRRYYYQKAGKRHIVRKLEPLLSWLPKGSSILDIGSGGGLATAYLRSLGYSVTPLDIINGAFDEQVTPVVYDGTRIPFENNQFQFGLILTVLHHTPQPSVLLQEALRCCEKVVILEDIYFSPIQKKITFMADSLVNLWYAPCPHTNQSDAGWRQTFAEIQVTLRAAIYRRLWIFFQQAYYLVDKMDSHQFIES